MRNDANTYVYKDYGSAAFGNFEIDYDVNNFTSLADNTWQGIVVLSNSIGTLNDLRNVYADGIGFYVGQDYGGGNHRQWGIINLLDGTITPGFDTLYNFSNYSSNIYFRVSRIGTGIVRTCQLKVYTDSNRLSHVVSYDISLSVPNTRYKYLYALCSADGYTGSALSPDAELIFDVRRLKIISYG